MLKNYFAYDRSLNSVTTGGEPLYLWKLAIPIMLEQLLRNMLSTVNTLIVSRVSDTAASAIGTATQLTNIVEIIYMAISMGAFVALTQNLGAGNREKAEKITSVSIVMMLMLGVILGIALAFTSHLLMQAMNLTGEVLEEGTRYFRLVAIFGVFQGMVTLFSYICRSYGITHFNLYNAILMNVLNAVFSYLVVFEVIKTPFSMIEGVAYSKILSILIALLIYFIMVAKARISLGFKNLLPVDFDIVKDIFRVGIPSGITSIAWCLSQAVCSSMVATYGVTALNAKTYADSLLGYPQAFAIGVGQAGCIISSRLVGAGRFDDAYNVVVQNHKICLLGEFICNTLIAVFGRAIVGMFTTDPAVIELANTILWIDIAVGIGKSFNLSLEDALRGSGDATAQMYIALVSCFIVTIIACYLLGTVFGLGLIGCWIAYGLDEWFRGISYSLRWTSRKWEGKRLIHDEL